MLADRTDHRRGLAFIDIAAVATDPGNLVIFPEYGAILNILFQHAVTFLMILFDRGDQFHFFCDFRKSFFLGGLAKEGYMSLHS